MRRFLFLLVICATNYGSVFGWCDYCAKCWNQFKLERRYKEIEKKCVEQLEELSKDEKFKALYEHDDYQTATEEDLNKIGDSGVCLICQNNIKKNDSDIVKTSCNHFFHKECLGKWFKERLCCPACNRKFGDEYVGEMDIIYSDDSDDKLKFYPAEEKVKMIKLKPRLYGKYTGTNPHFDKNKIYSQYDVDIYVPNSDFGLKLLGLYVEAFRKRLIWRWGKSKTRNIYTLVLGEIGVKTQWPGFRWWDDDELENNQSFLKTKETKNNQWILATIKNIKNFGVNLTDDEAIKLGKASIGKTIYTYPFAKIG